MEVKSEEFVSWHQAKKILDKKYKERELGYEQKNALEHLKRFSRLTDKAVSGMEAELSKIERLKDRHIAAIINMLPSEQDELRLLFANEVITVSDEDKKRILSIIKKFTK